MSASLQGKWSRRAAVVAVVALLVALHAGSFLAFSVAGPAQKGSADFSQVALEDLLPSLPFESRRALVEREILRPSPIQALALPHIGSGKHAVLISKTGSGKTLAYLLPAVQRARLADEVLGESTGPSSVMILTPTRELAVQILSEVEDHCQGIIALVTLSARASWYTLMDASVIIGTPTDILEVFDDEDAKEVKDLLGRVEVVILDELDELLPKQKFTGRKLARYQDPGMWPAEGLLKRLMRNNDRESLQLVAASATAYLSSRLRLEQVMQRDKLKRFPVPLPRLDPQRSTAAVLQAAAAARAAQGDEGDEGVGEVGRRIPGRSSYRALPAGIQHYTWKVPLSGSHAAAVAAALDILRPESALIFVCPNAGESVKGVVKDLTTAGWSNVDTLSRALFPDSRSTNPGKKASQVKGEAKGWRSANRLVELRDATKRGYSQEGDFYREAPIFVSAEESVRGLHLDAVEVVFILGLPKTSSSYVHMVRCGPDYAKQRQHMMTTPGHLYQTLTVDSVKSSVPLHSVLGSAASCPPPSPDSLWTPKCPLPRVLCINVMLPYYNPKNPWALEDGGCSYVGFFEITNETVQQSQSETPPPSVQLFRRFCEGPAGFPGCPLDHPDRSMSRRRDLSKFKDMDSGLLRAAGWCLNQAELGVPEFLHQFNGKSFVIADSGYVIKDTHGEWLEVGFDVRKFPFLFVEVLYNFRDFIPKAKCHYGFTVQAVEDEDMPEGIICDVYMSGINILDDPIEIDV